MRKRCGPGKWSFFLIDRHPSVVFNRIRQGQSGRTGERGRPWIRRGQQTVLVFDVDVLPSKSMNTSLLAIYLFSLGIALAILYFCFLLHKRFAHGFLQKGLYYLAAFFAAGLIDLVGRYLAAQLMGLQPAEVVLLLRHVFVFLTFPFVLLALTFFMSYVTGLIGEKISPAGPIVFAAFWTLFFLTLVVATKNFLGGQGARFSGLLFALLDRTAVVFYLLISGFLWVRSSKFDDGRRKRAARILSLTYLLGFSASGLVMELPASSPSGSHPAAIILYFSLNLPPLLVLRSYLKKFQPKLEFLSRVPETRLEGIFAKYGLSKREQEIIRLVLEGQGNKDIARKLYISLNTVKNHSYHIYQKLGVKNRLRLAQLIREQSEEKKE